jgi:hypothetical protein
MASYLQLCELTIKVPYYDSLNHQLQTRAVDQQGQLLWGWSIRNPYLVHLLASADQRACKLSTMPITRRSAKPDRDLMVRQNWIAASKKKNLRLRLPLANLPLEEETAGSVHRRTAHTSSWSSYT